MTAADASGPVPSDVLATLNYYLVPEDGGSETYTLGSGNDPSQNRYDSAQVVVHSIRGKEADYGLHEHGFELLQGIEAIQSSEKEYLKSVYSDQVARTIKARTGASEVVVLMHVPRGAGAQPNPNAPARYATLVHVDQSFEGARVYAFNQLPHLVYRLKRSRWAIINWWQPFARPATRTALALCDERSIPDAHWREITGVAPKTKHQQISPVPYGMWRVVKPRTSDEHKWYFAPDMQTDEALLFKIFDSKTQGVCRRTPHCAFESPLDHGPERASVEYRCVVIWDNEPLDG